jgi:hypothetical protein
MELLVPAKKAITLLLLLIALEQSALGSSSASDNMHFGKCINALNGSAGNTNFSHGRHIIVVSESDTCYNVLSGDYTFYLPSEVNIYDKLDLIAKNELSTYSFSILPSTCKASLKAAVCQFLFPECAPGWVWNNTLTWNSIAIPSTESSNTTSVVTIPYLQPCRSVCDSLRSSCYGDLLSSNSDTGPIIRNLINCSSHTNYSAWSTGGLAVSAHDSALSSQLLPLTYGSSLSHCTSSISGGLVSVAEGKEELYDSTASGASNGVCSGIISDVYIPPLSPYAVAAMQSPNIAQRAIELGIKNALALAPAWLSSECYLAARKYLCSSRMLRPQPVQVSVYRLSTLTFIAKSGDASVPSAAVKLDTYSTYMPSYPAQSVCQDYVSKCDLLITLWLQNNTELTPHCSTVNSYGVSLFPTGNQTVLTISQSSGSHYTFEAKFVTSPASLSSVPNYVEKKWTPTCPQGFVVPEDKSHPRLLMIPGTGCAESCRYVVS